MDVTIRDFSRLIETISLRNMRCIYLLFFLLIIRSATAQDTLSSTNWDTEDWSITKQERGMQVYFRHNRGTNQVECKIVTELEAPVKEVLAYVTDAERFDDWVGAFRETRLLQAYSPDEYQLYGKFRSRLLDADSDIILRFKFYEVNTGVVGFIRAEPQALDLNPPLKRIEVFDGRWAIQQLSTRRCRFTYQISTDLGPEGIGDALVRRIFLQANTENVERLREHFTAAEARK